MLDRRNSRCRRSSICVTGLVRASTLKEELFTAKPRFRSCGLFDRFIYWWRAPLTRLFLPVVLIVSDHVMYNSDPANQSLTNCRIAGLGHCKHLMNFSAAPDLLGAGVKAAMGLGGLCAGWSLGRALQRHLGQRRRWEMFEGSRGGWMLPIFSVMLALFAQALLWNVVLTAVWGREACERYCATPDLGISNKDYARLTQTLASTCEVLGALSVLDMILQDSSQYPGWGLLECGSCSVDIHSLWSDSCFRLVSFWTAFAAGIAINHAAFEAWEPSLPWTEVDRGMCASSLFLLDLLIITQDWEFPSFTNPFNIKLLGTEVVVNGKWMNYAVLLVTALLDLNNFSVQVKYNPALYGQYADASGQIWMVRDVRWLESLDHSDPSVLLSELRLDVRRNCSTRCPEARGERGQLAAEEDFAWFNPHAKRDHCCGDQMLPSRYVGYAEAHGNSFLLLASVPLLLSLALWTFLKMGLTRSPNELCRRVALGESIAASVGRMHEARQARQTYSCEDFVHPTAACRSVEMVPAQTFDTVRSSEYASERRSRVASSGSPLRSSDAASSASDSQPASAGSSSSGLHSTFSEVAGVEVSEILAIREQVIRVGDMARAMDAGLVPVVLQGLWAVTGQGVCWLPLVRDYEDLRRRLEQVSSVPPSKMRIVRHNGDVLTHRQPVPATGKVVFVLLQGSAGS